MLSMRISKGFLFHFLLLFFILPLRSNTGIAQNIIDPDSLGLYYLEKTNSFRTEHQIDSSNTYVLKAISFFQDQQDWDNWSKSHKELVYNAFTSGKSEDYQLTIQKNKEAIEFIADNSSVSLYSKAVLYSNIAYIYHQQGNYSEAINFYETAIPLLEKAKNKDLLTRLYGSIAPLFWERGDIYRAIKYNEKALTIATSLQDKALMSRITSNLGNAWRTIDAAKSIPYYLKATELNPNNSEAYAMLSKGYLEANMSNEKALQAALKSLDLSKEDDAKTDALHQLGRVYFTQKKYSKALDAYDKALQKGKNSYGKNHPEYAKIHLFKGDLFLEQREYDKALQACNETLNALLPLFHPIKAEDNPKLASLTNTSLWILEALQRKSEVYSTRFKDSQDFIDQENALFLAELAVAYLQKIKTLYGEAASKYEMVAFYIPISGRAIELAYQLAQTTKDPSYLERAFALSTQTKAMIFSEALYQKELKHIAGVPKELLEQEHNYSQSIIQFEQQLVEESDLTNLNLLKDSLFKTKRALEALEVRFETDYPQYAQAKYAHRNTKPIAEIQADLSDQSLLLEYFVGEKIIYTFSITTDSFWVNTSTRDQQFDQALYQFRRTISDWAYVQDSSAQASTTYLSSAWYLYQQLLETPLSSKTEVENIYIIPDKDLAQLPFEVFLTQAYQGSWTDRAVPFLLKEKTISYRFSSGFSDRSTNNDLANWGGFGTEYSEIVSSNPVNNDYTTGLIALRNNGRLPFADDEVRSIGSFLGGQTWLNEDATRSNFLQFAPQLNMLHLATHGIIDTLNPFQSRLLFSQTALNENPYVSANEIYGMQLNADLTVLSACNSGMGVWKSGEGSMSLARAFSYAGSPSIVMSLWNVADQSTATLMTSFYENLQEELPKDRALQNAKLDYLENVSATYAKPIYWAGFVLIGNPDSLSVAGKNSLSMWAILGIGILIFGVFYMMLKKK